MYITPGRTCIAVGKAREAENITRRGGQKEDLAEKPAGELLEPRRMWIVNKAQEQER